MMKHRHSGFFRQNERHGAAEETVRWVYCVLMNRREDIA